MIPDHKISIGFGVDGSDSLFETTEDVLAYSIVNDMLSTADAFSFELPVKKQLWDLARLDAAVQVHIDGVQVLSGFVDSRTKNGSASGSKITVTGRDRGGRLVDESAPFVKFRGKGIEDLAQRLTAGVFERVTLEGNAQNRALITGRRGVGVSRTEPAVIPRREARHQTKPGEVKSQVMDSILEQAELMSWSSADGKTYIVGVPQQRQDVLWSWLYAEENSRRAGECNVLDVTYSEDIAERYSEIRVVGTGKGGDVNFGSNVTRRFGRAFSDYQFTIPKILIIGEHDIESAAEAVQRAEQEMAERESGGTMLDIVLPGHGQGGLLYAFDTVGQFEDETIGVIDDFYITRVEYRGQREDAQTTLSLVPVGTDLRSNG